jgi:hypothetical protein
MAYISSNNNRWYCQLEPSYGQVGTVTAQNRISALEMTVQQKVSTSIRKDKTGTRTYLGAPANLRKQTNFQVTTYMTAWTTPGISPGYGPMFESALGSVPMFFNGGSIAPNSTTSVITFEAPHGLSLRQAITYMGEIRFVTGTTTTSVVLNSPFTNVPVTGAAVGPTVTYQPATELPSYSLFDYWTPVTAVQRLLSGCAVDQLSFSVNADYQQFQFKGYSQDVLDSSSFAAGEGQLSAFPIEPALGTPPTTIVAGHLGQAWLGTVATQFLTLTSADVTLNNQLDLRNQEFGFTLPKAINPGLRKVLMNLGLYGQDDTATTALYQAARQRLPISAGFQLGSQSGELLGFFMGSVVPEVPQFNDKDTRLLWQFEGSQAQGLGDDEIAIAFG